jgi:hypothetical protein
LAFIAEMMHSGQLPESAKLFDPFANVVPTGRSGPPHRNVTTTSRLL